MKKNVALCYSGQIRNFKECFPTQLKHIIQCNRAHYNFYIFGHFWNDNLLHGKNYWANDAARDGYSLANVLSFLSCNPDSYLCEKPLLFNSNLIPDERFPHPIENVLSMFSSMYGVNQVKNTFAQKRNMRFDATLRLRTDLYFTQNLDLNKFDDRYVYVNADTYQHTDYSINDIFAVGNDGNMSKYFSVFQNINYMVSDGCAINPECFLGFNLQKYNVPVYKIPMQDKAYKLFRDL